MVVSTWLALAAEKDLGSLPSGLGVSPRAWLEKDCRQCLKRCCPSFLEITLHGGTGLSWSLLAWFWMILEHWIWGELEPHPQWQPLSWMGRVRIKCVSTVFTFTVPPPPLSFLLNLCLFFCLSFFLFLFLFCFFKKQKTNNDNSNNVS